jgi:hypothetical protein
MLITNKNDNLKILLSKPHIVYNFIEYKIMDLFWKK